MTIQFHPRLGQVLYCDFTTGFAPPEMVKNRPVVVLSRKHHELCTVVPLSGSEPDPVLQHHHKMSPSSLPPSIAAKGDWWAKCDLVTTVAFHRLDRVKDGRGFAGKRIYSSKCANGSDLRAIQKCVLYRLCMNDLKWDDE